MRVRYRITALLCLAVGLTLGGCGQASKPAPSKPAPTPEAKAAPDATKKDTADSGKTPGETAKKDAAAQLVVLQVKGMV